jgi:L-ascorbate metabolism protein UlaG (beta-lactamase superfamily)
VTGSILEFHDTSSATSTVVYQTGDTLIFDRLAEIRTQFQNIDVAFLHLGGTRVMGIMVTMDAEAGVEMLRIVQPTRAIPIHFDDYDLFTSPLSDFQREVERSGLAAQVLYLERDETWDLSA